MSATSEVNTIGTIARRAGRPHHAMSVTGDPPSPENTVFSGILVIFRRRSRKPARV